MSISNNFLKELDSFTFTRISDDFLDSLQKFDIKPKEVPLHNTDYESVSLFFDSFKKSTNIKLEHILSQIPDIHPLKAPFTLFSPMGYDRWELAYTKTLAFLLNQKDKSILSKFLFESIMNKVIKSSDTEINIENASIVNVVAEKMLFNHAGKELGRADIIIEALLENKTKCLVFIEAKVDACLGADQILRYDTYISEIGREFDHTFKVFLTASKQYIGDEWVNLTFVDVLGSIEEVLKKLPDNMEKTYLAFFASSILKDILGMRNMRDADQYAKYKIYSYLKSLETSK